MTRRPYGNIAGLIVLVVVILLIAYEMFKRYNSGMYAKLVDLQSRNIDRVKHRINAGKRQQRLQLLGPKLQIIENRLKNKTGSSPMGADSGGRTYDPRASSKALSTRNETGKIRYDARRLFDMMDTNGDGELCYDELNYALELNPVQLREFTRRMNHVARKPAETDTISRPVFVKSFLFVLEQISHFEPTFLEADQLFDEILEQQGTTDLDEITHESLFASPIAEFLNETQINELIKRFRYFQAHKLRAGMQGEEAEETEGDMEAGGGASESPPDISVNNELHQSSPALLSSPTQHKSPHSVESNGSPGRRASFNASIVSAARRRSLTRLNLQRAASASNTMDAYNPFKFRGPSRLKFGLKIETISREEFVHLYPKLLTEIMTETEAGPKLEIDKSFSVDVTFSDLSLAVTVKRDSVTIVNKVTGRLQAGTMTALMGGSGAGKLSQVSFGVRG